MYKPILKLNKNIIPIIHTILFSTKINKLNSKSIIISKPKIILTLNLKFITNKNILLKIIHRFSKEIINFFNRNK